jgi:hypothetical protein
MSEEEVRALHDQDSIVCYLQRFRTADEGANCMYRMFNTKDGRLCVLTRMNGLIGEEETAATTAAESNVVGAGTRGRIATKARLLLNETAVIATLDVAEQRCAAKAAETARKGTLSEQRQVVVMQLKLCKYLPVDDAGGPTAALPSREQPSLVKSGKGRMNMSTSFRDSTTSCSRTPCTPGDQHRRVHLETSIAAYPCTPPTPPTCFRTCERCFGASTALHRIRPAIDSDIRSHIFSELCSRRESRQRAHSALHTRTDREEAEESAARTPVGEGAPPLPNRRVGCRPEAERHHAERSAEHPPFSRCNYWEIKKPDCTIRMPVMRVTQSIAFQCRLDREKPLRHTVNTWLRLLP